MYCRTLKQSLSISTEPYLMEPSCLPQGTSSSFPLLPNEYLVYTKQTCFRQKTESISLEDVLVGCQKRCTEACKTQIEVSAANQTGERTRTVACILGLFTTMFVNNSNTLFFLGQAKTERNSEPEQAKKDTYFISIFQTQIIVFLNGAFK